MWVSSARSERLVNLVLCLLSTRQFLSAERIRNTVAGYRDAATDEAFFRMFERDKAELRELGVPVETGRNSYLGDADGYRIARRDYELPDIELTADEAAALALAARLWDSPQLATSAHNAVLKLRSAGVEVDTEAAPGVQPRVRATDPAFGVLVNAVEQGRVVTFQHRRNPASAPTTRTVEPWGVVSYRGRWYLAGHDRARMDVRCFRVSRIFDARATGPAGVVTVPEDADVSAIVAASAGAPADTVEATLLLVPHRALGLRRGAKLVEHRDEGDVVELTLPPADIAARWIAGYGSDAVVLAPKDLRDRVLQILSGAAA